jgi:hypothetical protein
MKTNLTFKDLLELYGKMDRGEMPTESTADALVEDFVTQAAKMLPRTERRLRGVRFEMPQYRQPDYPHYTHAFEQDFTTIARAAILSGRQVEANKPPAAWLFVAEQSSAGVTAVWSQKGKATLFIEEELAQALLRTDLPEGFTPDDLHWRRDAFRFFLPKGLFRVRVDRRGEVVSPTCVTFARMDAGVPYLPLLPELLADRDASPQHGWALTRLRAETFTPDSDRVVFSVQVRSDPRQVQCREYYSAHHLDGRSLTELAADIGAHQEGAAVWDASEKDFMREVMRFCYNALLYLGAVPLEYEPKVIRPAKEKKGRLQKEVLEARFLGQELYRPSVKPSGQKTHEFTGRKLEAHWRAGSWRRQPCGPGWSQRKLIWVAPYRTHGPEET